MKSEICIPKSELKDIVLYTNCQCIYEVLQQNIDFLLTLSLR
jgi:hypothetical protein